MRWRAVLTAWCLAVAGCASPSSPALPVSEPVTAPAATLPPVPEPKPAAMATTPLTTAETATLTVTVKGVGPEASRLLIGLFDEARYQTRPPPFTRDGPAQSPEKTVTFEGLKPGRYAVKTMQDLNGNNDMDMTLLGFPEEPFGFSNDVKPIVSEPSFKQTSFEVKPGANAITIHLQRM